ncbi:unnamed protein product [Durusdinium trenchii]|uniref:N-acetyltransferase domain-containing protein n=1 Tax=Durusdinium trenchii TaxID=1381693 RepID=A0ABP0QBL1_9DINO
MARMLRCGGSRWVHRWIYHWKSGRSWRQLARPRLGHLRRAGVSADGRGQSAHGVLGGGRRVLSECFVAVQTVQDLKGKVSEEMHDCYFVDLFVRPTNTAAIKFYEGLGYVIYRTVTGYYSGDEDAYDMRKPLRRDDQRKSVENAGYRISPEQLHASA